MILPLVLDFLAKNRFITETRFGRDICNDPRLVRDIRDGRIPGPALDAKIRAYIKERS